MERTALVTGASRGIGRAIAVRLAADGARVAVHYGSGEAEAEETVQRIRRAGGQAFAVRADLGRAEGVDELFAGLGGLDVLVNNAAAPPGGPIEADTPEAFDRLFAVNVRAPYFIVQRALPLLNDGARIVNVSSAVTRIANPAQTSFAMTKGALETMSRTLAQALGERGITVNAVAPGGTRTETNGDLFTPEITGALAGASALRRVGRAEDVAAVVAFLASDDARWITGQVLDASGGLFLGLALSVA